MHTCIYIYVCAHTLRTRNRLWCVSLQNRRYERYETRTCRKNYSFSFSLPFYIFANVFEVAIITFGFFSTPYNLLAYSSRLNLIARDIKKEKALLFAKTIERFSFFFFLTISMSIGTLDFDDLMTPFVRPIA